MESPKSPKPLPTGDAQLVYWLVWNVLLPTFLLLLLWPIYRFVLDLPQSFERSFGSGDLLLFSALLLITTSVRLDTGSQWRRLNFFTEVQKLIALVIIMVYGMVRADVAMQSSRGNVDESKLWTYSVFSLSVLFFAISVAVFNGVRRFTSDKDERTDSTQDSDYRFGA